MLTPFSPGERNRKPGNVKATPAAIDSPAEPVVCIMLFSRMVVFKYFLPRVIAITAMGIDAVTVRPARSARYTVEAPNKMPKSEPNTKDLIVNSAIETPGATYGRNAG